MVELHAFLKLGWYVGRVTDVAQSGAAFELESISFLASSTLSRKWLVTAQQKRLAVISREEAVNYARQEDLRSISSLLDDQFALQQRWETQVIVDAPFPSTGQFLHCVDWFGRLLDVCIGDNRTMLVVESAKMLSRRGSRYETIEIQPKDNFLRIRQALKSEVFVDIEKYSQAIKARIAEGEEVIQRWNSGV